MRKADTSSKLFMLPLIPALAFGIVEIAARISRPVDDLRNPVAPVIEHAEAAPVKFVIEPPPVALEPECRGCTLLY